MAPRYRLAFRFLQPQSSVLLLATQLTLCRKRRAVSVASLVMVILRILGNTYKQVFFQRKLKPFGAINGSILFICPVIQSRMVRLAFQRKGPPASVAPCSEKKSLGTALPLRSSLNPSSAVGWSVEPPTCPRDLRTFFALFKFCFISSFYNIASCPYLGAGTGWHASVLS